MLKTTKLALALVAALLLPLAGLQAAKPLNILWPNRLIGDAALPMEKRFTETNMRKFVSASPLLPSGLLGPVQVLAEEASR